MLAVPLDEVLPRDGGPVLVLAVAAEVLDTSVSSRVSTQFLSSMSWNGLRLPFKMRHLRGASLVRGGVAHTPSGRDEAEVPATILALYKVAHGGRGGSFL